MFCSLYNSQLRHDGPVLAVFYNVLAALAFSLSCLCQDLISHPFFSARFLEMLTTRLGPARVVGSLQVPGSEYLCNKSLPASIGGPEWVQIQSYRLRVSGHPKRACSVGRAAQ